MLYGHVRQYFRFFVMPGRQTGTHATWISQTLVQSFFVYHKICAPSCARATCGVEGSLQIHRVTHNDSMRLLLFKAPRAVAMLVFLPAVRSDKWRCADRGWLSIILSQPVIQSGFIPTWFFFVSMSNLQYDDLKNSFCTFSFSDISI